MALPLAGKIIIPILVLAVIGGMVALIVVIVNDQNDSANTTLPPPSTTPLTTPSTSSTPSTEGTTSSATPDTTTEGPIAKETLYQVGVGIADMTGPCVEVNFMGYAEIGQSGRGLHTRQFSRAFLFVQGDTRIVLVTADVLAIGIGVRREVVKNLQELYGDMYSLRNVILTGTHTHSAPGGHLVDLLLDITILGFSRETYNAYVAGITRSIVRAHENIVPARLFFGQTRVSGVQKNRSPFSYENNPAEERERYDGNTDAVLTQVRIEREDGSVHGALTWFPLHATSMNMTNRLISADNLGYAAVRLEKELNAMYQSRRPIVAGFFPANLGDVSPNTQEARCEFSDKICDNQFVLCDRMERCFAGGPGKDMFESTQIIGTAVFEAALEVLSRDGTELKGDLAVMHQFINVPEEVVPKYDPVNRRFITNEPVRGCKPALGYSFASGTTDGANVFNITQGTLTGVPELDGLLGAIMSPTVEDIECHAPKPILLATARANSTIPWHTQIVSATVIWLGGFAVAGVPGEPTTMSGRRIRDVLGDVMRARGYQPRVEVMGLTNEYIHYISTFEEYQVQRYEAASTLYGPHTLEILLNKFAELTAAAIDGGVVDPGPEPEDHRENASSLLPPVILDATPIGRKFGDVLISPPTIVRVGDVVSVAFVAANPRNDIRQESSHADVERYEEGEWFTVATDADWETRFHWERISSIFGTSRVRYEWHVPAGTRPGTYRIVYRGAWRSIAGFITQFTGATDTFIVQS
ncbi:Neutral ceramidase [Papilio xuthus]|uniref:Neutral ceramidase n=1 Tax=Papilio xuthus TaxID=66420 RepID=A0A194PJR3_PAPXU|nr:Neutral ceramidase [Papilio xuthus]